MGEIEAAATLARADGFIDELRDLDGREGYNSRVGERGVKLSGGQRQRIAIAPSFSRTRRSWCSTRRRQR